jgi:hypothetical protein
LIQQSLYCPRKAFFQDRFRGFPSGTALPLLLGSVVHELFQVIIILYSWFVELYYFIRIHLFNLLIYHWIRFFAPTKIDFWVRYRKS